MSTFRFEHVCLEAMAVNLPPNEVTSAQLEDRLAPLYQRLQIPFGTLEKLSGIKSRYLWPSSVMPSQVATAAALQALEQVSLSKDDIGIIFNCSVTRDYFEPATACIVHHNLGLPEQTMALDITNACIGFSNGIVLLSNLIESRVVKAGIIVTAETVAPIVESTIKHLTDNTTVTREDLLKILPTFTIGSGAVAYILCHDSLSKSKHRIRGATSRSATQHCDLCNGNADYQVQDYLTAAPMMYTESSELIGSAAKLGGRMFKEFSETFGWSRESVNHIFCHQVGKQVNRAFYEEEGLDIEKEFTIYSKYGNLVSAAMPTALALGHEERGIKTGDKVLLTAYGSGLNSIFIAIEW
jgi:acyl-CoA:acyl-CoA alkyltransferase